MTDTTENTGPAEDDESTDEEAEGTAEGAGDDADEDDDAEDDGDDDTGDGGSGTDPRLLEELDEHIREARAAAEEAFADSGHSFVKSEDSPSEDEDDGDEDDDDQPAAPGRGLQTEVHLPGPGRPGAMGPGPGRLPGAAGTGGPTAVALDQLRHRAGHPVLRRLRRVRPRVQLLVLRDEVGAGAGQPAEVVLPDPRAQVEQDRCDRSGAGLDARLHHRLQLLGRVGQPRQHRRHQHPARHARPR